MEYLSSRREREAPWGGGRAKIENSSRRHPRKFGQKRFLAVRRSWRGNGVACFGLPPWKKFSAAWSRSSRSAREDGCSSLPCRGVLSFWSGAREASGSETPRVHHATRRRGCLAARGARMGSLVRCACPVHILEAGSACLNVRCARLEFQRDKRPFLGRPLGRTGFGVR